MNGLRTCTRCGRRLPLEEFARDRSLTTRVKRRYHCKDCGRKAAKRYRTTRSEDQYRQHLMHMRATRLQARRADRRDRVETAQLMVRRMVQHEMTYAAIARLAGVDVKTPSRILRYDLDVKITRATVDRIMQAYLRVVRPA